VAQFDVSADSIGDWYRNIVTLRTAIGLFDDLVDDARDAAVLVAHEMATKPIHSAIPIVQRPFEEADYYAPIGQAIAWPFAHPLASRYSDGRFGVWYGADSLPTGIHETVHHFRVNTLASEAARHAGDSIIQERRVYLVRCDAMLVDLRAACAAEPRLTDPDDHRYCHALGAELEAASLPGVLSRSARHAAGCIAAVFHRHALSQPRDFCYLTYRLDVASGRVDVERQRGKILCRIH
jgi:RES domain